MTHTSMQPVAPGTAEFHRAISARSDHWYAACLRITRNPILAEDAVQDALLSAWRNRHQFEESALLETWIHRIAVNAALQLLRKRRPEQLSPPDEDTPDDAASPERARAQAELDATVCAELARLTDIERVCFVLRHLEQWRLAEIAAELDASTGTVKQALFRAVRKLRVRLTGLRADLRSECA